MTVKITFVDNKVRSYIGVEKITPAKGNKIYGAGFIMHDMLRKNQLGWKTPSGLTDIIKSVEILP